jgi:two-component system, NarL family, response regulator DegU
MIRIILVDDHQIVRDGLKLLLSSQADFEIVAEGKDGQEAIELVKKYNPDVLISDISMPNLNGLESVEMIKKESPGTKVMFLSMFDKEEYVTTAVKIGAHGYLLKDSGKEEMIKAIRKIADGDKYFSSDVSGILVNHMMSSGPKIDTEVENDYNLTKREIQILSKVVDGWSNKQIADDADISVRTIETHRLNIMKKMKVNNAADLVRKALVSNLVK